MEIEDVTPEMVRAATLGLVEGFVREGLLVLPMLTDDELDKEFNTILRRFLTGDDGFDYALTFDHHTDKLLSLAKSVEAQHDLELSCLFYMLWIEHRVNLILRVLLRRKSTPEKDAINTIRKLSVREKLTWFWKLMGLEALPDAIIADATMIEEFRNGFVHYKWQAFDTWEKEDHTWQAVNRVGDIIAALQAIEERHVYYGQRQRLAAAADRAK